MFKSLCSKMSGMVKKWWAWMRSKFPSLNNTFDRVMSWIAWAILILTIGFLVWLARRCVDPIVIVNVAALSFLAFSIPVSLIRGRNNWQWPVTLAAAGVALWCMSTALGPSGGAEILRFFSALTESGCGV